jgi:hypothetical protein
MVLALRRSVDLDGRENYVAVFAQHSSGSPNPSPISVDLERKKAKTRREHWAATGLETLIWTIESV